MNTIESDYIFNSPLETGIRALCILSIDDSLKFDLQQLVALDHLIVHTGDFENGPESLHPNTQSRAGELIIRRNLIERGLMLMEYKGLVSKLSLPNGFFYTSTDLAHVFIDSMTNNYIKNLINRSEWAIKQLRNKENDVFKIVFKRAINNWSNEFEILDAKKHNNDRN
ncbi:ABC-three component system middle component 2 [Vibrio diabolicus]|uniref:ABC-three component system middle component 2 n=1 Tax=Vibrio diabolicus TaxID=50719 RepID=UPI0037525385